VGILSKLGKLAKAMSRIVRNPRRTLLPILNDDWEKKADVVQRYGLPNGLPEVDLTDLVPNLDEVIEPYTFLEGTAYPVDIALLKALGRRYENCRYLEIGTWRGESVSNMATVAKKCVTVDLPVEDKRKYRIPEKFIEQAAFFSRKLENVVHVNHNSHTFDYGSLGEKFDLIFVDADHSYEAVKKDTQIAFSQLRNEESIIVWHDYGFTPDSIQWNVLAGILDGCPPDKIPKLFHVASTLCAIYFPRGMTNRPAEYPPAIDNVFKMTLSARKVGSR
jgi:hypothetical protein